MRYSKQISTGLMIESQSGGDPDNPLHLSTMKANAVGGGIAEADVEVGYCTDDEHEVMLAALKTDAQKVKDTIKQLESTITPRRLRDALANDEGKKWVADVEALIATERGKL